jgi:DNA polymerase-3 subunit delta
MAKTYKQDKPTLNYSEELKKLRADGPERVYILRGEEDYLRDSFLKELRTRCVEEGSEAFNYHRLQGANLDLSDLRQAVEAMPFMGEHTLTEVREFDINRTAAYDGDGLKALLADLPEWATVAFVFAPGYAPDNRLGIMKAVKKLGHDMEFSSPREAELIRWVTRRAEDLGKEIDGTTANYLMWVCGSRMNTLIPEIVKIAGVAKGKAITKADIDAVAKRAPETTIFNLTDALGAKEYDKAAGLLADLLADRDEPPQKQIAMVSEQFRRLYVARVAQEYGKGEDYITSCIPELSGRSFLVNQLRKTCRSYSLPRLARAVRLCVECDYGMKNGGPEPAERMKELLLRLAMDRA